MADTGRPARRSAVYALDQILGEGLLMSELLAAGARGVLVRGALFDSPDPGRATRAFLQAMGEPA